MGKAEPLSWEWCEIPSRKIELERPPGVREPVTMSRKTDLPTDKEYRKDKSSLRSLGILSRGQ